MDLLLVHRLEPHQDIGAEARAGDAGPGPRPAPRTQEQPVVYMNSALVFMFIDIFLDVRTPGGAFVWPSRNEQPPPHIVDYLFISLQVNSTHGPTSEALISRKAKLVMTLQVLLAIVMLTVLIARAVSSTS
jgi:hypothetical protein